MSFDLIVANTLDGGIGLHGKLPWGKLKKELDHFMTKTTSTGADTVVMGYNTWVSIGARPLKKRKNLIITKTHKEEIKETSEVKVFDNFDQAIEYAIGTKIFVIGGAQIYKLALAHPGLQKIYQTAILKIFEADTYIEKIDPKFFKLIKCSDIQIENDVPYQFLEYQRILQDHPEYQYLNLIKKIFQFGTSKGDRTGTGIISIFGAQLRFDLSTYFPLLTTKKVFFRGVAIELLWILSGSTDTTILNKQGVHIWDSDTSREKLDQRGFKDRQVGDLGPGYGFQLRHFGAKYIDCKTDYKGQGADQLMYVINTIKKNPEDRRILFNLWNPMDIGNTTLPPCHLMCQFYVNPQSKGKSKLSAQLYLRSSDVMLGLPFNIASYALLTYLIAEVCNLIPDELIIITGDTHIYKNQLEAVELQLTRKPMDFPKLEVDKEIKDIEKFTLDNIKIQNYKSHDPIRIALST